MAKCWNSFALQIIIYFARLPIGSHAGKIIGLISKTFITSAGTKLLSTTTSKTNFIYNFRNLESPPNSELKIHGERTVVKKDIL